VDKRDAGGIRDDDVVVVVKLMMCVNGDNACTHATVAAAGWTAVSK